MAVNGNNFLIKLFEKNCRVGRKPARQRKRTIQEWVKQNKKPDETNWLTGAENEAISTAWATNDSEEQAKLVQKFSLNNNNVPEEPFVRDMDTINKTLEELKNEPDQIEFEREWAEKLKKRKEKISKRSSSNLQTKNTNWAALAGPDAQNHQGFQSSFTAEKPPQFSSSFETDKILSVNKLPEISSESDKTSDKTLPLRSSVTEQESATTVEPVIPEVRETPSGHQEQTVLVESQESMPVKAPCEQMNSSDDQPEDTEEIEKPISFRTYAKGNEKLVESFSVDEMPANREFVRFFPILRESPTKICDFEDKSDDESSQIFPKTDYETSQSSSPKEQLKEKPKDQKESVYEDDIESDVIKKKLYLRAFVKTERPENTADIQPSTSSFEKDGMMIEGTADDPMDPDSKWVTLTEVFHENLEPCSRSLAPERTKRECKFERDVSISRPKIRRKVAEKDSLVIAPTREIPPEHRNKINLAKAVLESQQEQRPEPTFYPTHHRLNNSRLGRILGDQHDEIVFENSRQIKEN